MSHLDEEHRFGALRIEFQNLVVPLSRMQQSGWLYPPQRSASRECRVLPVRKAPDHHAFVRHNLIPDRPREVPDRRAAAAKRFRDDLILKGVLADAGKCAADFLDEAVAEAGLARLVVVLRSLDIAKGGDGESDRAGQGAG
jgi:hypothetical protein